MTLACAPLHRHACVRAQIDLPFARTIELLQQSAWDELLQHDQLLKERANNRVFYSFYEAPSLFPPSYRYSLPPHVSPSLSPAFVRPLFGVCMSVLWRCCGCCCGSAVALLWLCCGSAVALLCSRLLCCDLVSAHGVHGVDQMDSRQGGGVQQERAIPVVHGQASDQVRVLPTIASAVAGDTLTLAPAALVCSPSGPRRACSTTCSRSAWARTITCLAPTIDPCWLRTVSEFVNASSCRLGLLDISLHRY